MTSRLLEFDPGAPPVIARDAATIIVARDAPEGPEIFCVERNKKSRFLGGAIVFPGGKLDEADRDRAWDALSSAPGFARESFAPDPATLRALAIAALRETLEEAALLIACGGDVTGGDVLALRARALTDSAALPSFLRDRGLLLDAARLHPLARWVTPSAETRRYDTRFFVAVAPPGQAGAHDMQETMASFWARPTDLLARFDASDVQLAPPTHRTLEVLAGATSVAAILAIAARARLAPICPKLVHAPSDEGSTLALTLPGDPEHDEPEALVEGRSRYVLRSAHWRPEHGPGASR